MLILTVSSDERVGFIGQTRSGKTFLAQELLADQPRVIVVDTKGDVHWKGYYLTSNPTAALAEDKVIYRPGDKAIPESFWERALDELHERGGGIVYVDEAAEITTPNRAPKGLKALFRLGGGLGVGVWWSSQEATSVFNTLIRQSTKLVMFYNQGASDRDKLMATAGDMAEATAHLEPDQHEFIVYQNNVRVNPQDIPVYRAVA